MQRANEDLQEGSFEANKVAKSNKSHQSSQSGAYQRAAVQQRFGVIGGAGAGAVNAVELMTKSG